MCLNRYMCLYECDEGECLYMPAPLHIVHKGVHLGLNVAVRETLWAHGCACMCV